VSPLQPRPSKPFSTRPIFLSFPAFELFLERFKPTQLKIQQQRQRQQQQQQKTPPKKTKDNHHQNLPLPACRLPPGLYSTSPAAGLPSSAALATADDAPQMELELACVARWQTNPTASDPDRQADGYNSSQRGGAWPRRQSINRRPLNQSPSLPMGQSNAAMRW
jgi:hypothetical protein